MRRIEVVAAIIFDEQGRIFATQRGYGDWKDWWEFPGGKIEAGETLQQALKREIHEELDVEIEVDELLRTIDYDYPQFHLTMHCFKCKLTNSHITLLEHEAASGSLQTNCNRLNGYLLTKVLLQNSRSCAQLQLIDTPLCPPSQKYNVIHSPRSCAQRVIPVLLTIR